MGVYPMFVEHITWKKSGGRGVAQTTKQMVSQYLGIDLLGISWRYTREYTWDILVIYLGISSIDSNHQWESNLNWASNLASNLASVCFV